MVRFNNEFEQYKVDISFQYACNMCFIQIGELVNRLSGEVQTKYNHIPWHAIRGMRNLHAHDYENVDLDIVWHTLKEDIPELQSELEKILDEE